MILAGLLALTTFWAIWDMIHARAPWQGYQMRFNAEEKSNLKAELDTAEQEFNTSQGEKYQQEQQRLAENKAKLEGEEFASLQAELAQSKDELTDAMQDYRFAKSEHDALWYQFEHAQHENQTDKAQRIRPKVDELNAEVDDLKTKWDDAEAQKSAVETRIAEYRANVDKIQADLVAMRAPLTALKERVGKVDDRKIKIEQFVLHDFVKGNFQSYLAQVDRCTSCHVNADKGGYEDYETPFKTHPDRDPLLKIHSISKFGCSPCHGGQGEALRLPDAHGEVEFWAHPLLNKDFVEAGCNECHSTEIKVEHAPRLTKAKRMLFDLACYACHDIATYGKARKIGPPLNNITQKTTPDFIYRWIRNTKSFREHTRMPNPQYGHEEATAVVAYLVDISKSGDYKVPKAPAGGSVSRGEKLVESLGCKGCHVVTEEDRKIRKTDVTHDFAPELTKIGSKVNRDWLYAWIMNPKQYHPNTTMPRLRLSKSEAKDIVAYLMTHKEANPPKSGLAGVDLNSPELIAEGKQSIRNFGCHGCHDIKGMEGEGKVSVALNEFGGKAPDELFFGDALASGKVKEDTWDEWALGKMKNLRLYATEAVIQRMPNFAFNDDDAKTMAMLLKSWDGREIGETFLHQPGRLGEALEKGRRLVRQYNCVGCHIIEGEGGFIRPTIVEAFKKERKTRDAALSSSPPDLIGEGRKVQPDWLFKFLKNPQTKIRPWLKVRMPTFGFSDEEVNTLIAYFQALEGMNKPFSEIDVELTSEEQKAAEMLFSADYLSCFSCHQVGDKKPEGPPEGWAPDFMLAPDRLNPDWVFDWIMNPQAQQPGTKMPGFFPDVAESLPDILGGNADRQVEALRDYLMNIRRFAKRL